jgi:pyruvate formate lyase activating enzyme
MMQIYGLQKMTLLDYPEHVAATIFLSGCDFKCPFCHNFELVDGTAEPVMDEEELFAFLNKRKGILDGVAISGGEPCLHKELPEFIKRIRELGYSIKLDTNGYHPEMLSGLMNEGLVDYVAMDIKNSAEKYGMTAGLKSFDIAPIQASIDILMNSKIDYEFRTTVIKEYHNEKDFESIGEMIKGAKKYYLQQYICRDTVPDKTLNPPSEEELNQYLVVVRKNVPNALLRGL